MKIKTIKRLESFLAKITSDEEYEHNLKWLAQVKAHMESAHSPEVSYESQIFLLVKYINIVYKLYSLKISPLPRMKFVTGYKE